MKTKNLLLLFTVAVGLSFSSRKLAAEPTQTQKLVSIGNMPSGKGEVKAADYKWEFLMPEIGSYLHEDLASSSSYRLGNDNFCLKDYILKTYTRNEPIAPGNPLTRIVILKPAIFNAVKKIEKYYLAELKKNELTKQEAESGFQQVLKVAVAAATENTQSFEEALQDNRKDTQKLIDTFNQVKLKQM